MLKYLKERGYDLIPVNPALKGQLILGLPVHENLASIGRPLDMVEIFRASSHAGAIVDEALRLDPLPKVIWMQLTVRDDAAPGARKKRAFRLS